jgi:hypothetical protein
MPVKLDWKTLEKNVAEYFGGKRRKMRRYQLQGPDVNQPVADIEVKLRKKLPGWVWQYLEKVGKWNKAKLAVVVMYEKGAEAPEAGIAILSTPHLKILLDAYLQLVSGPSLPSETPSSSTTTEQLKSRWRSRPLRSRKLSS